MSGDKSHPPCRDELNPQHLAAMASLSLSRPWFLPTTQIPGTGTTTHSALPGTEQVVTTAEARVHVPGEGVGVDT